ncbi:mrg-domain-containing protein [Lichtheimia corymbifera JMRC:FSU:9682]|uniref:Chromatin modification-related protein EAF3 n=1 Tax=Lichtheimia corymbifera JMRC:FSU:9682 TaxID=1263082 RepID=A0A068S280_9FUNG|nr:mrg-domain-containing protein [Lichtheimia corymbifera JMRC:FSU:9682]
MSEGDLPAHEHYLYSVDERVLCFHGPLIYEAKILSREWFDDDPDIVGAGYYVHYKGWKNTWDEWVPESRVLRLNDTNIAMQSKLKDLYTQAGKKRPRDSSTEKEDDYLNTPEIRIDIPNGLKAQLVDDWENVTKNQQLIVLPRTPTVSELLEQYKAYKLGKKGTNQETLDEVIHGIKEYFNNALGTLLLYRFERHQYSEARKKYNREMVDIYGAEHLLRLFVQMPSLLAHTDMGVEAIKTLTDYLSDILRYMQRVQKQIFTTEYENPAPDYVSLTNAI